MNLQQLQTARAALWRQNGAPLATYDDAAPWLEEMGFCLFLPRHAQFPAPAPSLAEACAGAASATPAPAVIARAMELTTRLVGAGQAIPLNLLGTYSEQPDFLITTEVLPWVAAVRGERQWKTAPGGRTAPIVVRTWEALEQHGPQTAIQLREALGREVTEGAVLRALIELWTTVRAMPVYAEGEATRWHLLKEQHAAQLTTGANTAQATALSALISLYLRSAVAATGEEAEIFLSPLTARSRIREVLHGMTATRQLGTMSVASQTLLFVEGSLPEVAPEPEQEPAVVAPNRPERRAPQGRREEAGRRPERQDRERRPERQGGERQDRERRGKPAERFRREDRGPKFARPPRREFRPAAQEGGERRPGRPFEKGGEPRREGQPRDNKPWQKRREGGFQQREGRPPFRKPFGKREEKPGERRERPPFRKPFREERPERAGAPGERGEREERPRFGKGARPPFGKRFAGPRRERNGEGHPQRPGRPQRPERPQRPGQGPGLPQRPGRPQGPGGQQGPGRPQRPGKKFERPFGRGDRPERGEFRREFGGRGPARGGRPERGARPGGSGRPGRENRGAFQPGKKGRRDFKGAPRPASGRGKPRKDEKRQPEEGSE